MADRSPAGVAGYSTQVVGASGVDQAAQVPPGQKSPAIQFAPSGSGVYRLQGVRFQDVLTLPCLGFSAFMISAQCKGVVGSPGATLLDPIVRVRVYSRNFGLPRLLLQFRVSAPYSIPNYHFYEVADTLVVRAALSDPNPTAGAPIQADIKVTITGLA